MSDKPNDTGKSADNESDVAFVKALAEVLRDNDLTELEVERGSKAGGKLNVRVSRNTIVATVAAQPAAAAPVPSAAAPAPAAAASPGEDPSGHPGVIPSPMVGTIYLSAEPGAPPFVKVGDAVSEGQTLLIVEAMKTMNHIHAPISGTVKRILVEDGAAVEYGAPLMIVE
ncbi:MAG: acetyl-CoA carboxylase biotin carboxyl carrier protein [Rhodobacter sp.]|nr:acetyl-CoA carboxylase biotin carboxyl carrier protein [Rhodobacter sp.]